MHNPDSSDHQPQELALLAQVVEKQNASVDLAKSYCGSYQKYAHDLAKCYEEDEEKGAFNECMHEAYENVSPTEYHDFTSLVRAETRD